MVKYDLEEIVDYDDNFYIEYLQENDLEPSGNIFVDRLRSFHIMNENDELEQDISDLNFDLNYFKINGINIKDLIYNSIRKRNIVLLDFLLNLSYKYNINLNTEWIILSKNSDITLLLLDYVISNQIIDSMFIDNMLVIASNVYNLEVVQYLIDQGADVNFYLKSNKPMTPLGAAVLGNKKENVKVLLENGSNINLVNDLALMLAMKSKNVRMFDFLLSNGSNINADNNKLLIGAIHNNSERGVKFLRDRGAEVNENVINYAKNNNPVILPSLLLQYGHNYDNE